jgi:C-terminal processing protease CtpA/Prc
MRQSIVLLALLFATTLYSQNNTSYLDDLNIYREIVETSHTGMYLYTSETEFDSLFSVAEKKISDNKIKNARQFYNLLAKLHTKLRCGHSNMFPTKQMFSEIDSSSQAFFPYKVKFIKDTLVVADNYGDIKKGTQIISINNKSIKEITDDAFLIISSDGYNTTLKYHELDKDFAIKYFLLYGPTSEFSIKIKPYHTNATEEIKVTGIKGKELPDENEENTKPVDLQFIDDKTALLTIRTFETETNKNQKKFFKFLKSSFKQIKEKDISTLIIDIRENGGGDDGNDMELASYLINKPFREDKYRKLNTIDLPLYPEYLHQSWYQLMGVPKNKSADAIKTKMHSQLLKEFYKADDNHYYFKEKAIIKREPQEYLFTGKTYILISGNVFSGGALFSALVRDKTDAIFVGEETGGGYYRHTGTIPLIYELPNSGIIFSIFIVINEQDVEQKLVPNGRGIIPQIEIYPSVKDFVEGKDTVLDFIITKSN